MLKLNVADYLIHNLAGINEDANDILISQAIDVIVDSWAENKYLTAKPHIEHQTKKEKISFEKTSLQTITNC